MKYKKTTLPNGLRVIAVPTKGPSVTVLVMVETGSNHESKAENGLSHFLEHMCFKGTPKRPSSIDVARELDGLGAENNAFTNHEYTGYWAKGSKKHFKQLLDIVSDIYLHPNIPAEDLEKERGVILQEINMYEDLPQSLAVDEYVELSYGGTPAGQRILGPKENIQNFKREDFVSYMKKHYVAKGTIVVVAGDIETSQVLKEVKSMFKGISISKKSTRKPIKVIQKIPGLKIHVKDTDQTHMVIGFRSYKASDKKVATVSLISTILGGGMSSRLFQLLREEMGVCYYVKSIEDENKDYGFFGIRTGVDRRRVKEVVEAILKECIKMKETLVSDEELNKAKEHLIGHLHMALETSDNQADFYAIQEALKHEIKTPEEIEKEIRKVTAEDIMKVAKEMFQDDRMNMAVVGNVGDEAALKKLLKL
jgi:predicted Zn-dependent peptidase